MDGSAGARYGPQGQSPVALISRGPEPWILIHDWAGVLSNIPLPAPNRPQPWARWYEGGRQIDPTSEAGIPGTRNN